MRSNPSTKLLTPILAFCSFCSGFGAQAPAASDIRLQGHVLGVLPTATRLPRSLQSGAEPIILTLMLNWSDPVGFAAFGESFEDPASPAHRKSISASELTARFGPTQQAYDTVLAYLQQNGFTLVRGSANRLTITVSGSRAQAEQTFGVAINDYQLANRQFHANDSDPAIPAALAPFIRSVSGFSNLAHRHPAQSVIASGYDGALSLASSSLGDLPLGIDGTGQIVGVIDSSDFQPSDLEATLTSNGFSTAASQSLASQIANNRVYLQPTPIVDCAETAGCAQGETLLDIASVLTIAPGANVVVYLAPDFAAPATGQMDNTGILSAAVDDMLNRTGGFGGILSASFDMCEQSLPASERDAMQNLLVSASYTGVTLFAASGDWGNACPIGYDANGNFLTQPGEISYPAGLPYAVAVGGTALTLYGGTGSQQPSYGIETWWDDAATGAFCCGGYGISEYFSLPEYQQSFTMAGSRSVPDVSIAAQALLNADPVTLQAGVQVCQASKCWASGGTSMGTPLWAGIWALASQGYEKVNSWARPPSAGGGFLYDLYDYDAVSDMTYQLFHTPSSMSSDFAHVGLGSPDIANLVGQVAGIPQITNISPSIGPTTGGTRVSVYGHQLSTAMTVAFNTQQVPVDSCDNSTTCYVTSPAGTAGSADVITATVAGLTSPRQGALFTYAVFPAISGISPSNGPTAGGTVVTITGTNFSTKPGGTTFVVESFGSPALTSVACSSTTMCTATMPPWPGGDAGVLVSATVSGNTSQTNGQFTYNVPPPSGPPKPPPCKGTTCS